MATSNMTNARVNDFLYDPLFVVSGEKDYYKAAMIARMANAKFAVCPDFPNMFSDLPHQARQYYVMRRGAPIPPYVELANNQQVVGYDAKSKSVDIDGSDRHKFFTNPVNNLKLEFQEKLKSNKIVTTKPKSVKKARKKIQTQYRESSAQTIPWQPNYVVVDDGEPELLMLDFLKWGSGLPAGMHEVQLIERARMKRAWEKSLPPVTGPESLEQRRRLIEAMERDEYAFRDQEIQDIQDLRLELLQGMLNELLQKSKTRVERKMESYCKMKDAEKEEKIRKLHYEADRELRKIRMKQAGVNSKYHLVDVVEEHGDRKSELYGPLMRHGENPKRWHDVIDEHLKKYRAQFLGVEHFSTLPRWLDTATKMKDLNIKLPGTRLCLRETKWTTPVLKELHEELKNLRKVDKRQCNLERVESEIEECETPAVEGIDDWEEEQHQAVILIESVLRGRASQVLIFEGRDRCRELIRELRTTHALQEDEKIIKFKNRLEVKSQQRENLICKKNIYKLQECLNKLSGTVVGTLLDFLNKELRRLLEERRCHAVCLLYERERRAREAAEAGRRQKELRRQREHDEMFKQVVKVHQDTVDVYLQDIITEGMDFVSKEQAARYVENLANKIDEKAYSTKDSLNFNEKEELIAELVHNFLLPEVEKEIIRDKIKKKQHNYLAAAHEEIYNRMDRFPKPKAPIPIPSYHGAEEESTGPSHPCVTHTLRMLGLISNSSSVVTTNVEVASHSEINVLFKSDSQSEEDGSRLISVMEELKYKEDIPVPSERLAVVHESRTISRIGSDTSQRQTNLNLLDIEFSSATSISTVQKQVTPESESFYESSEEVETQEVEVESTNL